MDAFTCQQFKEVFGQHNRKGVITTTDNGRKYNVVVWDSNKISVKRDLTDVSGWTRFSETISRWSQGDFKSNAEKWEHRLTIQKQNVQLAEPANEKVNDLEREIANLKSGIEPKQLSKKIAHDRFNQSFGLEIPHVNSASLSHRVKSDPLPKTINEDRFQQLCAPLSHLLETQKQHLDTQREQLCAALNQNLSSSQVWTQQQDIEKSISNLHKKVVQFESITTELEMLIIEPYFQVMMAVDLSKNPYLYDGLETKLTSVVRQLQQVLDDLFKASGELPQAEIDNHHKILADEIRIAEKLAVWRQSADLNEEACNARLFARLNTRVEIGGNKAC